MATVKAKIYEHHEKADGTFNVKYVVYHQGKRKFIDSPHFLSKRQLTPQLKIKDKLIQKWVDEVMDDYRELISGLRERLDFFTCEELRDYLRDQNKEIDIVEFANKHISYLKANNREPYSRTFCKVRNSLIDYFGRTQISINEILSNMLFSYERFLKTDRKLLRRNHVGNIIGTTEKALTKGGLHAHMRDLRGLFNEARRAFNNEELDIIRIKHYPFTRYKIGAHPPTRKRNIQADQIMIIRDCKVPDGSRIELARDLFMLSFYMCGTNAVDFFNADENNLKGGRFEYNRSKTEGRRLDGAFISRNVPQEAKELLIKYIGKLQQRYRSYTLLDYALYKGMDGLRKTTGLQEIVLYWARHSFGTLARNECRLSADDIGAALNHVDNGHATTDIYIEKDWRIVDDVQNEVINLIRDKEDIPFIFPSASPDESRRTMRLVAV